MQHGHCPFLPAAWSSETRIILCSASTTSCPDSSNPFQSHCSPPSSVPSPWQPCLWGTCWRSKRVPKEGLFLPDGGIIWEEKTQQTALFRNPLLPPCQLSYFLLLLRCLELTEAPHSWTSVASLGGPQKQQLHVPLRATSLPQLYCAHISANVGAARLLRTRMERARA